VLLFALLLLVCSVVPVFAAEPEAADNGDTPAVEREVMVPPDGEDVQEGLEVAERREAERLEWLQSPEAVREREESRNAYAGLSASEAQKLLTSVFEAEFAKLDADPARLLSDVNLAGPVAGESVVAIRENGETDLLDAGIPIRTEDDEGQFGKVDLSLEATPEGFEPSNPLIEELVIPDTAGEPIEVGDEGLAISAVGVAESRGAHRLGDEDIYFNAVLPDVGYLVAPIGGGVELFNVLYSEASPEALHYELELPAGAHLRADGMGGAQIVRNEEVLAYIPFPSAVDAQGTQVPVEMEIEGDQIDLHVAHRGADYAMPILVDPAIHENHEGGWYWGDSGALKALDPFPGVWNYSTNDPEQAWFVRGTTCLTGDLCSPSGRGLFMFTHPKNFPANVWGHFWYWAPGATSYIPSLVNPKTGEPEASAVINPFWRNNHGCSWNQYPRPYDYNGSFDANGNWQWHEIDRAQWYGNAVMYTKAKGIAFGMSTGSGGWTPCYRSIMAGGYAVRLDDEDAPVLHEATVPLGWVGDNANFTVAANASDGSLGVHRIRITPDGRNFFEHLLGCAGTAISRCPNSKNESISVSGDRFNQGERPVHFAALDPTEEPVSNTITKTIKVDTTPPEITLKGQLAKETSELGSEEKPAGAGDELSLPVYNLVVEAKDFTPGAVGKDKRSGVKNIEIYLDGVKQPVPWPAQSCTTSGGCPATMVKSYPVVLSNLQTSGAHKAEVIAIDQVGEKLKRTIEFEYFPATGMKDEYVMHYFPLPDGQGNEAEEEHPNRPELAVNVANGNLVYRETDVDVESTAGVDLEVDRYYNSMLPNSENGELGDGWTLGQAPELDPDPSEGANPPAEATMLRSSAAFEENVALPASSGQSQFDPQLQALVTKQADGDFEVADETEESGTSTVFDQGGRVEEILTDTQAKAVYDYEAGKLTGIDVTDPATFTADPSELEIEEPPTPRFQSAFGSIGTGNGQLKAPADVAVDAAGNVWVADKSNHRIQKFSPNGEYLTKFGSFGAGNGQLSSPAALAIDAKGNIWVADKGNSRIQKFNASGEFLLKFGTPGSGDGQFVSGGPEGIAVDAKGNVWVSDTYGGRLQKFSQWGIFIKAVGSKGTAPGQLGEPTGIDVGPGGNIWVADWQNNRIAVFNEAGEFVRQFGSQGSGNGQFSQPDALDVDSQGNVWVGDQNNHRVQQFDQDGNYVAKFGSPGSAAGQFNFTYPMGITTDGNGALWIADVNNNRIQRFQIPRYRPSYHSSFGGAGSGVGKFNLPADVAFDRRGYLWVVDQANNRIQQFDPSGEFVSQFGVPGSANGQFDNPAALAIDANGDIWVVDKWNHRIQKFNEKGEFLAKFGTEGSGEGQFVRPEGITIDASGNIWISDTFNHRIQKFNSQGGFLEVVDPAGMGWIEPTGIDVGPGGKIWVADWQNNRVVVLSEAGKFVQQFGSSGAGPGQFNRPDAIEVDAKGRVWVGDQYNNRIQQFNQHGEYVAHFGSSGSGPGQFNFSYPFGIASAGERLWIADRNNNRVQRWESTDLTPTEVSVSSDDDPSIDIETEGGVITEVKGQEAGTHSYAYSGPYLVSHAGPAGQTTYEKDSAGRLTKVTLPNGTWGKVEYRTDGRVKSVVVDPAGAEPTTTTQFEYTDAAGPEEARSTKVIPSDAPHITYDIGPDGSVFKWRHIPQPPQFLDISGSLWAEKESKIAVGDHLLKVIADSPEGIASIQIIANGDTVVSEKTCQQTEEFGIECTKEEDEWVVGTADLPPGILYLEVIVSDRQGEVESERFWVEVPYTPPPDPETPMPPSFRSILEFREEHGLEVVFPVANESELNERIFNLIGAWNNPNTPAGEVARATMDRWGVPLRSEDAAELEYRLGYWQQAQAAIPAWVNANAPASFAGFYLDERAGGLIRVGFTGQQQAQVDALKQGAGLAAASRVTGFASVPQHSLASLEALEGQIIGAVPGYPSGLIVRVSVDVRSNSVIVGATDVGLATSKLQSSFGAQAPIRVVKEAPRETRDRWRVNGRMLAGDRIVMKEPNGEEWLCTAGGGAWESAVNPTTNALVYRRFLLTAAHCAPPPSGVRRDAKPVTDPEHKAERVRIGSVKRYGWGNLPGIATIDIEAVRFEGDAQNITPRQIYPKEGTPRIDIKGSGLVRPGTRVCSSGATSGEVEPREKRIKCGEVISSRPEWFHLEGHLVWEWCYNRGSHDGDSGGPIWIEGTNILVGILSAGGSGQTCFAPLVPDPEYPEVPAAFSDPRLAPLNLSVQP
jgi:tripartite motif-containing protein 71